MHKSIGRYDVVFREFSGGAVLAEHEHDDAFATIVVEGQLTEEHRGTARHARVYDAIVHDAGARHSNRFAGSRTRCLRVQGVRFERTMLLSSPAAAAIAAKSWREFQHSDALSPIVIESAMLELFVISERQSDAGAAPRWLRRVVHIVEERFSDALTLTEVATELDVHPGTLAREFRRHCGTTFGERIRTLRVDYARQRLASNAPLHEIASDAGFADQSHFTRTFRRATGMTPASYRRALRS